VPPGDPFAFPEQVFLGLQGLGSGGEYDHAVLEVSGFPIHGDPGGVLPHEAVSAFHLCPGQDLDVGVSEHPVVQVIEVSSDLFPLPGGSDVSTVSAQHRLPFHQVDPQSLVRDGKGGIHPCKTSADHQGRAPGLRLELFDGLEEGHPGYGHADQVLGLLGGFQGIRHVNPGILIADVGKIEQVPVQSRLPDGLLEKGLVGSGGTGRHHDSIQPVIFDGLSDQPLGVLAAGKKVVGNVGHVGEGPGIIPHRRDVHHPPDVDSAMTHKDADAGLFQDNGVFGGIGLFMGESSPGIGQGGRRGCRGRRGFHHRVGDVLGTQVPSANVNAGPRGGHRRKGTRTDEAALIHPDSQLPGQFHGAGGQFHAHGKHHQVEFLTMGPPCVVHILEAQLVGAGSRRTNRVNPGTDEPNSHLFPGPVVIPLEVLSIGPHVHIEDRGIQVRPRVFFGDHRFLDGVHATNARAVTVASVV